MSKLELQKKDLLKEIEKLGYSSLRYSIFSEEKPGEWEVVIEYNQIEWGKNNAVKARINGITIKNRGDKS